MQVDYSNSPGMGMWPDTPCRVATVTLPASREVLTDLKSGEQHMMEADQVVTVFYAPCQDADVFQMERIDRMLEEKACGYAFEKAVEQAQVMLIAIPA